MSVEMKKVLRVAAVAVFFASVFFFVWQYAVAKSFPAKIKAVEGVALAEVAADAVYVTPAAGNDWPATCAELYKITASQKKPLVIKNGDEEIFARAAQKIRLAMAEAKLRGNFSEMGEYISRAAREEGLQAEIILMDNIFSVQLSAEGKYFYLALPLAEDSPEWRS
ncbi:MAG: hypothetical protein FWD39_04725 [Clostridiales bacterium]|nr:hypothetical protein [Clostridiales bacterium]